MIETGTLINQHASVGAKYLQTKEPMERARLQGQFFGLAYQLRERGLQHHSLYIWDDAKKRYVR